MTERSESRPVIDVELERVRRDIDDVDQEILELLSKRARHIVTVVGLKALAQRALRDPGREEQILERLAARNQSPFPPESIRGVFRAIIDASLDLEERLIRAARRSDGAAS
ncbi:MAG: chorismate mutase [bacterium]